MALAGLVASAWRIAESYPWSWKAAPPPNRRASNGGSEKCGGIPMDALITATARALAAG